jgi:signal transduction histidine kinase
MTLRRPMSLRMRLLALTAVGLALALLLAGIVLGGLFRDEVMRQFEQGLTQQLDQLTARVTFDAQGRPVVDEASLSDPRWTRPFSGLYWQINGADQSILLRSRSLWDVSLANASDVLFDGAVHVHAGTGPQEAPLLVLERVIRPADVPGIQVRLLVAGDTQAVDAAVTRFGGVLALSLCALLILLLLAAWAQVALGLAPLQALQRALVALREGRSRQIDGPVPREVQPLVDGFNDVLARNAQVVERARQQAGNLAHALKTPLAVLEQAAEAALARPVAATTRTTPDSVLAQTVVDQVAIASRQVDWHLARARTAGAHGVPGQMVLVEPVLRGLVRVMDKVHAQRGLQIRVTADAPGLAFAGEEQDLQEMLGNLVDNACKWARAVVDIRVALEPSGDVAMLLIRVQDDGPGISAEQRQAVLARGVRMDESVPGSGLGLAIVSDLAGVYGGALALDDATLGGLSASVRLPASAAGLSRGS